jgi:hypothetical protein
MKRPMTPAMLAYLQSRRMPPPKRRPAPMPIARRPRRTDSRTPAEILGTERNISDVEGLLRAMDRRRC